MHYGLYPQRHQYFPQERNVQINRLTPKEEESTGDSQIRTGKSNLIRKNTASPDFLYARSLIQYQYTSGKRKQKKQTPDYHDLRRQNQRCSYHKNQIYNKQVFSNRIAHTQQYISKQMKRLQNVGKICKNLKRVSLRRENTIEKQRRMKRFYSQPDIQMGLIKNQNNLQGLQQFFDQSIICPMGKERPKKGQKWEVAEKYSQNWRAGSKDMRIQVIAKEDHYQLNIKGRKLRSSKSVNIHQKLSSIKTRDSLKKGMIERCSHKVSSQHIEKERSKSAAVGTSTQDLQKVALLCDERIREDATGEQFGFGENGLGIKQRNTVLSEEAMVEELKFLRKLALRLYEQKQQFQGKRQNRAKNDVNTQTIV